jgi:hypothetical protein
MLEEILSVPTGSLKDTDTRDSVQDWSSLMDVQIMTVIGSELSIEEDPELIAFDSVGELLDELDRRGAFAS